MVAGAAAWTVQGWRGNAKLAEVEAAHASDRERLALATLVAVEDAREEERRRTVAVEKARDDAQKQAAVAAADAVGARTQLDRLRARADALARAAATRDPAAADGSPTGAGAIDLLVYMLGRAGERAEELARIADRARIAGLTCERSYDVLFKH
ncbi:DUF2514 family protein [Achromobacter anxifer]